MTQSYRSPSPYTLQSVAHNVRDPTAAYLKPPLLTQQEWDSEIAVHATDESCVPPLPLVPVAVDGFDGVNERMDSQDANVKDFAKLAEVRLRFCVYSSRTPAAFAHESQS